MSQAVRHNSIHSKSSSTLVAQPDDRLQNDVGFTVSL